MIDDIDIEEPISGFRTSKGTNQLKDLSSVSTELLITS